MVAEILEEVEEVPEEAVVDLAEAVALEEAVVTMAEATMAGWWPYYSGYGYDEYPPVVYIQREDDTQQAAGAQANYWHYCRNPEGYYPYVKKCPYGWLPVAPLPPTASTIQ